MSVRIDISIRADRADQLADAFAFILERGIPMTPGGGVASDGSALDETHDGNVVALRSRKSGGGAA